MNRVRGLETVVIVAFATGILLGRGLRLVFSWQISLARNLVERL